MHARKGLAVPLVNRPGEIACVLSHNNLLFQHPQHIFAHTLVYLAFDWLVGSEVPTFGFVSFLFDCGCTFACRVPELDPRAIMEHIELLLLAIDELVDGGYVPELVCVMKLLFLATVTIAFATRTGAAAIASPERAKHAREP